MLIAGRVALLAYDPGGAAPDAALAWTEDDDVWALTASAPRVATLAWTEADDVWSLTASSSTSAALAWTEADDTWSLTAAATLPMALAWTEADDIWALSASTTTPASLTGDYREHDLMRDILMESRDGGLTWMPSDLVYSLASLFRKTSSVAVTASASGNTTVATPSNSLRVRWVGLDAPAANSAAVVVGLRWGTGGTDFVKVSLAPGGNFRKAVYWEGASGTPLVANLGAAQTVYVNLDYEDAVISA